MNLYIYTPLHIGKVDLETVMKFVNRFENPRTCINVFYNKAIPEDASQKHNYVSFCLWDGSNDDGNTREMKRADRSQRSGVWIEFTDSYTDQMRNKAQLTETAGPKDLYVLEFNPFQKRYHIQTLQERLSGGTRMAGADNHWYLIDQGSFSYITNLRSLRLAMEYELFGYNFGSDSSTLILH